MGVEHPGWGQGRNMAAPTSPLGSQTVDLDPDCLCPVVHTSPGTCPSSLETSSSSLQVGAYVFIGVGAITMVMGFLGCIGAVNEVRCLLGLVSQGPEPLLAQIPRVGSSSQEWGADTHGPYLTLHLCPQYFVFLLLILIAQVTVGVLFYFNANKVSTLLPASS